MFKRHLLPWGLRALLLGMVLLWSLPATAAVTYQQIKSFGPSPDQMGEYTQAGLIEGNDGVLYGTTGNGGSALAGTIFKVNKDGTGYAVMRSFGITAGDGAYPQASLIEGNDGALYGTTRRGGSEGFGLGTVFKVNKDGTGYAILHNFSSTGGDGYFPYAGLTEGNDGSLYGTTYQGSEGNGTVFKMSKDGTAYTILHNFSSTGGDGRNPLAGLIEGNDGALYGTTPVSGSSEKSGTVFKVTKDGTGYAILHTFSSGDGYAPQASLIEGADGALYGTTISGGSAVTAGTVFKVNKDGTGYAVLRSFGGSVGDGQRPYANLTLGSDGVLYGTTLQGGSGERGTIFKVNEDGTGYAIVRNFITSGGDGQYLNASLTEGSDGMLYGTAHIGGSMQRGTVFKVNKDGTAYSVLHNFTTGGDGQNPDASLTEGNDGAIYGTTQNGGSANQGTIFKMNKDGTGYAILRSFGTTGDDGQNPVASLTEGSDGVLYGTTISGGGAGSFGALFGGGTVFRLNKDGTGYAILHSFGSVVGDGLNPAASLIEGNDGALYGTTANGGNAVGFAGGTVFKVNKDGTDYATLHNFASVDYDGLNPVSSLTEGSDGALYGTTRFGGRASEGAVFKMNKDGTGYAILHSFRSVVSDGYRPLADLIEGNDGALYGTTSVDGDGDSTKGGTVFKVNKDGSGYAILYQFSRTGGDGAYPQAGLTKGNDGALYGTTYRGGQLDYGTIYRISNNLPPTAPVQTFVRTSGLDLKIKNEDVLAACSDPEGGVVTLQRLGSSAQGATITQTATHILYTPVNGDNDQFTYTVSDAQGVTSTGTIQVQVVSPGGIVQSVTSNGGVLVASFAGIPGFNYEIQRATSPGGPWTTLVTQPAPANGLFSYTDPSPPSPSAFYRLIQP